MALLQAVARLFHDGTPIDVLIAGTGPDRSYLEREAEILGIRESVHFLGRLEDVREALAAMDVFVLPSRSVETFSNAALEAMAMALPCVLSKVGGAGEMVSDGVDGYLYERHDIIRLAELLQKLRGDPQLRRQIGTKARERVRSKFDISTMFDEYESVLGAN